MTQDAKFLIKTAKHASKLISKKIEVKQKDDKGDLVTNFDYEIEKFIIDKIKKNYLDFSIVSEEFNCDKTLSKNCFTIDPIDGTVNFANKIPLWAIQIACVRDGKTCASVIFLPKLKELYYADTTGAYLNGKKLNIKKKNLINCLFEIDTGDIKKTLETVDNVSNTVKKFRNLGSAGIAYAWTASGKLGGTIFQSESAWDYTPGMFLVKMAGGITINKKGCHLASCSKEFATILEKSCVTKNLNKNLLKTSKKSY